VNRRSFLGLLAGAGAATATSYFFAPIGGWKSDVIIDPNAELRAKWMEAYPTLEQQGEWLERAQRRLEEYWNFKAFCGFREA
jgi:hypothetical protein